MENSEKCKKCGQCCYFHILTNLNRDFKPTDIPCPNLVFNEDGTKSCSIYKDRLNKKLGNKSKCKPREQNPFDYEGCPYNTNKPMVKNHKLVKWIGEK